MKTWFNLMLFSFYEIIQDKVFRILLATTLLIPVTAVIVSSLFLYDIGKVYVDVAVGFTHVLAMIYVLFIVTSILARDVDQKVCYLLLAKPSSRNIYVCGRFMGMLLGLFLLLLVSALINAALGEWFTGSMGEVYRSDFTWNALSAAVFLHLFQYVAIIGAIFFVFSWATGAVEIMFFSTALLLFAWIFPPVLLVMQQPDVAAEVPPFLITILGYIYQTIPHLNGGTIALVYAHGGELSWADIITYIAEHVSYALVMLSMALWKFSKRDL